MKITNLARIFILTGIALALNLQSQAQQPSATSRELGRAAKEFNALRYAPAIPKLQKILEKDSANIDAREMLAYSYRMVKNYDASLAQYTKLVQYKPMKPIWALYYAEALASNQQYERSEGWYRKYLASVPADKRAAAFARANAGGLNKNIGNWKVSFTNLNTQSAEYAPVFYKGGLLFTSNRPASSLTKNVFAWNNTPFSNFYLVKDLKSIRTLNVDSLMTTAKSTTAKNAYRFNDDDTAPTSNDTRVLGTYDPSIVKDTLRAILSGSIQPVLLKGSINTRFHEGAAAVFPDGSIIFTRNNHITGNTQTSTNGINKLKLYTASGDDLNKITEFPYNSNEYSTGHPTLNAEGNILIFASDMPGGYGGTDLYYAVRSGNGEWTRPVNLGKQINTEGNEMFPSLDKNGTLYFASTGHVGLGGLDMFEVQLKEMKPVSVPQNMGVPINSPKDDFALIKSADGKSGYFSSNRRGNDDIYHFQRASQLIILQGTIKDANTNLPLAGSRLLMRHLDGTDTLRTNAKGEFRRELPRETDYEFTAQKLGYVNQLGFVTSLGITTDSVINLPIKLRKTESSQQFIFNHCDSLKKVFAVQNIYYDLDRYEIRPDARPALDELITLMKKYPEITVITSSHCDSRASEEYNRRLSLNRGASAKAFLVARGINPDRIKIEYYGKTRLVNRCYDGVICSEADQQLNRRTEFDIILNGVNITRMDCNDY